MLYPQTQFLTYNQFLEGLFQHTPHCKDFITSIDGLTRLGRLTGLPCLPYDFANSVASDSMVQVMRTMTEVTTSETLLHLSKLVKESLDDTKNFWGTLQEQSHLLPLVDVTGESLAMLSIEIWDADMIHPHKRKLRSREISASVH